SHKTTHLNHYVYSIFYHKYRYDINLPCFPTRRSSDLVEEMSKISIKNLDLYYGDFKALKNVNLEIEANKITAFIGPSGCGKSTLLKSINRMNDLVEGCRIDG